MYYLEVAPIKLIRQDAFFFTYTYSTPLSAGTIVTIPIGKQIATGVVISKTNKPSYKCKSILSVVYNTPIPEPLLSTAKWMADYYQVHLSSALNTLIPAGITKKRRPTKDVSYKNIRKKQDYTPTKYQLLAIESILNNNHTTQILHGVTGSGKTVVYIECAKKLFNKGLSSIILVPEISLTSQIVDEFKQAFGDNILVSHSKQTESQRHQIWQQALKAKSPKIVIGPRSALFLPLNRVGLIVLDEFHEPSYKQDQQPRYSSLRVATILAKHHKARAVFGSATPTISEYYLSEKNKVPILNLPTTARESARPTIDVVDMTNRTLFTRHRFMSDTALDLIDDTIDRGEQILIFHNRRGTTATTLCSNCGWSALDPETDLPLTLHADKHLLVSHVTGYKSHVPTSCPTCNSADIVHKGIGTKLIENELQKLYPNKEIVRFDGDSDRDSTIEQRYEGLYNGEIDIIIGTQVVAKGIDLPHLSAVCIIQADSGLALPDYSADERVFQLITQSIGRVGRSNKAASVVVQTYQPTHPAIKHGIKQDYTSFYESTIDERRRGNFPPFTYLARFTCTYKTEVSAIKSSQELISKLKNVANPEVLFFGPAPAFYEKQHGTYRWNIIAKSPIRNHLIDLANHLPSKYWQFELDPISLL